MKFLFPCFLLTFLFSGCTTLRTPFAMTQNNAIEQGLLFEAEKECCKNIFDFAVTELNLNISKTKMKMQRMRTIRDKKSYTQYASLLEKYEKRKAKLKTLKLSGNVFIDVSGAAERTYAFKYIIADILKGTATVTDKEDTADYKIQLVIKQDGIDNNIFNFIFLYMTNTAEAKVKIDAIITDNKTKEVTFYKNIEAGAKHVKSYIFGLGPFVESDIEGY